MCGMLRWVQGCYPHANTSLKLTEVFLVGDILTKGHKRPPWPLSGGCWGLGDQGNSLLALPSLGQHGLGTGSHAWVYLAPVVLTGMLAAVFLEGIQTVPMWRLWVSTQEHPYPVLSQSIWTWALAMTLFIHEYLRAPELSNRKKK